MPTLPDQYFDRTNAAKEYEEHLFIAGRGLQSAELNEIQKTAAVRLRGVADALFKDGGIVRDAGVIVDPATGVTQCASGAIYIRGAVRGVQPATFSIPFAGTVAIGVWLTETVITATEDPLLRDPATGTRNYDERGAERLKVHSRWGWDGDGGPGEFFPIYGVVDGFITAKEPPPNLDGVTQSLARYDRDSAGGNYVISGMDVSQLADVTGSQVYSIADGRARVYGYPIEYPTSRRIVLATGPDLLPIQNEPHLSTTAGSQRINLDRTPIINVTQVAITAEKTVTLTHGVVTGAQDPLPDTSVLQIMEVKQGGTTYVATTSYLLTAGRVDWSPAGAEPAPGSTYTVKYQYITNITPTSVDSTGFTITGAVVGSLVLADYSQMLPRIDRLCLDSDGQPIWVKGVSSSYNPQAPNVPGNVLPLASVFQSWTTSRRTVNDGVRVVPMPQLAAVDARLDWLAQLIAQNRLESSIHTREGGTKLGLFTDPFLDDSQRDAGTAQTAAIVGGELILPVTSTPHQMGSDITRPTSIGYTNVTALEQVLRTGSMNINPYMAFAPVPATMTITPAVDRWTDIVDNWSSATTARTIVDLWGVHPGFLFNQVLTTRTALLSTTIANVEFLRQIVVSYRIAGFGSGEILSSLTFDGLSLSTGGVAANGSGIVVGSFTIPANVPAGSKLIRVVGAGGSNSSAVFTGQGLIEARTWQQQTTLTENRWDPLAQTFLLDQSIQASAIDLWFSAKPTTAASIQIRGVEAGVPNQTVFGQVVLQPSAIAIGGASTRAVLEFPVTLLGGTEYAIVVLCNDAVGAMSVAEIGKFDSNAQKWITSQPYTVGVLLSSSNASTWTAHQDRDMAFRILRANYSATSRTIGLGNVAVTAATDLLLLAYADRPDSATDVEYKLTLPDASVITVSDSQPVQLAAAITGNVGVSAVLTGTANFSPILYHGSQLITGQVGQSADYVTRAIPGGASVAVKSIFEAIIPSGATVTVQCKGPDVGDVWTTVPQISTRAVDDGFTEFTNRLAGLNELSVQIKLTLTGNTAARPRVRDLRTFVM